MEFYTDYDLKISDKLIPTDVIITVLLISYQYTILFLENCSITSIKVNSFSHLQ